MPKKISKKTISSSQSASSASEADFNDTIARNRALPILSPDLVPAPPAGFVGTDGSIRARRLRRLSDELRAEARDALIEVSQLDLAQLLGRRAPDASRGAVLAERMAQSAMLTARAERLVRYCHEVDEIVLNDALVFLQAVQGEYEHEAAHDQSIAAQFPALIRLFEARSAAIAKGIARSAAEQAAANEDSESVDQ
jgi:hypothetical protein